MPPRCVLPCLAQLHSEALAHSCTCCLRLYCCVQVANLQLDDLEAGSLRGVLSAASLAADVLGRRGRGSVSAEGLRLSSLAVGSFGGAVRWEGDIVKLEETVLEQRGSRWGRSQVAAQTTRPVLPEFKRAPCTSRLVMYAGSFVTHIRGYRQTLTFASEQA